jgi:adenylate cyclase
MDQSELLALAAWVTKAGLAGHSETAVLTGFCKRAVYAGLPIVKAIVIIDTLHPVHEGHATRWNRSEEEATLVGYGRTNEGEAAERWRRTTFYRLLQSNGSVMRTPLAPETIAEFPHLESELREGLTEVLTLVARFAAEGAIGEMDGVHSLWTTDRDGGFADHDVEAITRLKPYLALAMKSASLGRLAATLAETYLGRDAGQMVMRGRIERGVADRIDAVLWFSDLRGYTKITDTAPPEQIIPLLNDYAEAVVSSVQEHGGDVLKLIGDGVLAIFRAETREHACHCAIKAATDAAAAIAALNEERSATDLPTTQMYLGLHVGEVFFGNIGSHTRLDFTVVGPAVNEVSRIAAMCRSADQPLLASAAFAKALDGAGPRLVSVGRYALRGVGHSQELFTLDSEQEG